jgi:hypothetical protein
MPFREEGAVRVHREVTGSGLPVLLIPGGGLKSSTTSCGSSMMRKNLISRDVVYAHGRIWPRGATRRLRIAMSAWIHQGMHPNIRLAAAEASSTWSSTTRR